MDIRCFCIIATILGILAFIVMVVMMVYTIIMKERIDDICRKLDDDSL